MRFVQLTIALTLLALPSVVSSVARADWVGPSQAAAAPTLMEVRVEEGRVEVALEIDAGDVREFRDLLDRERYEAAFGEDVEGEGARVARFFAETGLRVRVGDRAAPIAGRVVLLEERDRLAREIPRSLDGVVLPPRSPRVLFVQLEYPLPEAPEAIEVVPPTLGDQAIARLNIGFITLHLGMPVHDFRYLGRAELLSLDWRDAWYSRYDNRNLRRHHQAPVLDYVYIDDFEVRHEILVRVRDLAPWLTPAVASSEVIAPAERAAVAAQVGELMATHNPLSVNGETVELTLDRVDYIDIGLRGITVDRGDAPVPMARAAVGVILSHPLSGLPDSVEMQWELFSETISEVPAFTVDPVVRFPAQLTEESPDLGWRNILVDYHGSRVEPTEVEPAHLVVRLPVLAASAILASILLLVMVWRRRESKWGAFVVAALSSLIVVIAAAAYGGTVDVVMPREREVTADPERARALLSRVLDNVYRSFEAREEGDVYDRLAVSVHGEPLQALYLEQRRAFAMEQQGGAVADVDRVELIDVEDLHVDDGTLRMRASWMASGTVGHWGHTHRRTNQYLADVALSPVDGVWKLSAFEVQELERVR